MEDANLDLTALLLQVATQRSKAAYGQLFHYFAPRIRHYGLRHLRSEARAMELVQDTLLPVVVQPNPLLVKVAGAVTLAGTVSVVVMGPVVAADPMLLTVMGRLRVWFGNRAGVGCPMDVVRSARPITTCMPMTGCPICRT